MRTPKQLILEELKNTAPIAWQPGMSLNNTPTNGNVAYTGLGYQYTIQTTTLIRAEVVNQKFYEIPFADYIPVIPGEAAWMENIKTNLVYKLSGPFENGLVNTGSNQQTYSKVNVGTAPVTQTVALWAKSYDYSVFEVNKALALNNWDVVTGKLEALKMEWDLGIQKTSFLGLLTDQTDFPGLLTQPNVNINLTVITKNISSFANSGADMNTFVSAVMAAYFLNSNNTVMPDHFEIPLEDYLGLAAFTNPAFPLAGSMMIDVIENAFKKITGKPNFVIYGCLYGNQAVNAAFNNTDRYMLYRKDPKSLRMDLPMDFVLAAPVPVGPVTFEGLGYGQFTGVVYFRPAEALYFDHT